MDEMIAPDGTCKSMNSGSEPSVSLGGFILLGMKMGKWPAILGAGEPLLEFL